MFSNTVGHGSDPLKDSLDIFVQLFETALDSLECVRDGFFLDVDKCDPVSRRGEYLSDTVAHTASPHDSNGFYITQSGCAHDGLSVTILAVIIKPPILNPYISLNN